MVLSPAPELKWVNTQAAHGVPICMDDMKTLWAMRKESPMFLKLRLHLYSTFNTILTRREITNTFISFSLPNYLAKYEGK